MPGIIILTTTPDRKVAERIAKHLVREKLAACVSISEKLISFYRWKGKIEKAGEVLLVIKSQTRMFVAIEKFIKSHHPYELPEIIRFRIDGGSREYLLWLQQNVK